jgi:hypothetical protein
VCICEPRPRLGGRHKRSRLTCTFLLGWCRVNNYPSRRLPNHQAGNRGAAIQLLFAQASALASLMRRLCSTAPLKSRGQCICCLSAFQFRSARGDFQSSASAPRIATNPSTPERAQAILIRCFIPACEVHGAFGARFRCSRKPSRIPDRTGCRLTPPLDRSDRGRLPASSSPTRQLF